MKPKSLMKRSAFASRRKVLLYVLTAILAVSIVGAWGVSDGIPTVPVAGERIVMWQELPDSGTPEDYDLLTNLKFASQRIYTASYFRSETNGTVVGKSAGIPITQTVRNTRVKKYDPIRGDIIFSEAISTSSLVDSYEQQYSEGDIVFTRQRASGSGDDIVWEDKATHLSLAAYSERYGTIPKELSKYVIGYTTDMQNSNNTVFTVLSARDENAMEKPAANAAAPVGDNKINGADGAEVSFDVPQTLVADENGHYTFTVELDPLNSTKYYRNEVKTRAGKSASYPTFISSSITFTIDRNWNPISVTTNEKYEISIGISATCTSTLTEVFYQINDPDGKVPEEDFFAPRVDEVRKNLSVGSTDDNDDKVPDSPIEYLAVAFADYFGGVKPLSLTADVSAGDFNVESLKLSVDFGTMNVRVKLGALYAEYIDDKVYITLNDIKGYIRKDKFTELMQSGALSGITFLPDFSALMGDDAISKLFADCEMTSTDGVTRIRLPFDLDGIAVDASLYMNDKDLSLNSMTGSITAFGTDIKITAKPVSKLPAFPASYDGYTDLSGMLDFVPDAITTALGKTYGVSGTVTFNDDTFGVNAYIDRTNGLKLDADVYALGQTINIKYINGEIFASIGNINVRGTVDKLPNLLDAVAAATGINLGAIDDVLPILKQLIPTNADSVVGMFKSIAVSDSELSLGMGYMGIPLNITLRRGNGRLTGFAFDTAVDMFGIKANASANLELSAPAPREVTPPAGDCITFAQLSKILTDAVPYINAESYAAQLNGTLAANGKAHPLTISARINRIKTESGETVAATADVCALGQTLNITYTDGTAYISVGSLRFKLATDKATLDEIKPLLNAAGIETGAAELTDILSAAITAVKSLAVDADGAITAEIAADGVAASAKVNVSTGDIDASINAADKRLTLAGSFLPATPEQIVIDGEFTDAIQLLPAVAAIMPIITEKSLSAQITLDVNGKAYPATVALSFADGLSAQITEHTYGTQITVIGKTAYVALGDIKVVGSTDDIPALIDALRPALPQTATDAVDGLLGMFNGDIDLQSVAAQILGAIKSFTVADGNAEILLALGETASATVSLTTDLSTVTVKTNANGASINAEVYGITAGCAPITAPDGDFAAARELIAVAAPVLPLAMRESLAFSLGGSVLGVTITRGDIYIDRTAKALSLDVTLADFNAAIALVGGTVYIDVNGGGASPVKLSCGTSPDELKDLLHKLDYAMPGIEAKVYELLEILKNTNVEDILGMLALSSAENGFKATIDTRAIGFDSITEFAFTNRTDGFGIAVTCAMATDPATKLDISAQISVGVNNGEAYKVSADSAQITVTTVKDGNRSETAIDLISPDAPAVLTTDENIRDAVTVSGRYVPMSLVSEYIAPAVNLVKQAQSARTVTLELDAFALISDKYTQVGGEVTLALDEITDENGKTTVTLGGVYANLILFKNTVSEETMEITYVNDIVYIKTGEIALSLDMSDGADSDFVRLYNVLSEYLPEYLNDELAKLLGLKSGASMFSDISLIIERITELAAAHSAEDVARLLFAPLNNLAGDSAVKTLLNMISLSVATDNAGVSELVASLTAFGVTANITPHIADGEITTLGLTASMQSLGLTLGADAAFTLSSDKTSVAVPANAADYVSVAEFVEAINNAVHTFTTRDEDGNITFEVTSLDFDYSIFATEKLLDEFGNPVLDENGNEITVKDEAGRDKPAVDENGNKVVESTVKVNNKPDQSAIKGKFETVYETDENGERITDINGEYVIKDVRFCLEAHIALDIGSLAFSPITLDLYVLKTDEYPDGIACVYYTEGNGYGERISIDYVSVMQILAAVMDIVGAKDETVEYLLGEYRLPIDTDVFDSMAIAGFDTIREMLDGLAQAVIHVKDALADAKAAINLINTAGSVDNLRARLDDITETETVNGATVTVVKERGIKSCLSSALANVNSALAAFGLNNGDDDADSPAEPELDYTVINGELFKKIVNGVRFVKTENSIGAVIDNSITTDTDGEATVEVTQSNKTVDSIAVGGLDINTAKLDNFDIRFTAGKPVSISLPADYASPTDAKVTYSNLADIKHLLFDVMNTANLMEFDIGGLDTSDSINIDLKLGADWLANLKLSIKYNAKVKIVKVGEDSTGKPIYKTAAAVEIHNEKAQVKILNIGSKVIVPDCTTRLFFYDDVIYIQGVRDWQNSTQQRVVGTVTDIVCDVSVFGKKETRYPTIKNTEYLYETTDNMDYVEVMYTVDELFWMMNNDMNRFLNEFLFYLVPITTEKIVGQDIRALITNNISGSSSGNADTSCKTPAQIFKGYTYKDGKHSLTIGLAELACSSSLSDLNISLTGANDGDDNILDNYISSLNINTKIAGIISVNLDAMLRNVNVLPNGTGISSKGLAPTNITRESGKYTINGANYALDCYNYDRNAIYTLDGLTYLTADGNGLYSDNGTFAPALRPTSDSEYTTWTSTSAETRYCDSVYKFGDTGAQYKYTAALSGYGYRYENTRDDYYIGVNADGSKYVYRIENGVQVRIAVKSITENVLAQVERDSRGNITSVTNRSGGVQWARPWKADYDAAQAA